MNLIGDFLSSPEPSQNFDISKINNESDIEKILRTFSKLHENYKNIRSDQIYLKLLTTRICLKLADLSFLEDSSLSSSFLKIILDKAFYSNRKQSFELITINLCTKINYLSREDSLSDNLTLNLIEIISKLLNTYSSSQYEKRFRVSLFKLKELLLLKKQNSKRDLIFFDQTEEGSEIFFKSNFSFSHLIWNSRNNHYLFEYFLLRYNGGNIERLSNILKLYARFKEFKNKDIILEDYKSYTTTYGNKYILCKIHWNKTYRYPEYLDEKMMINLTIRRLLKLLVLFQDKLSELYDFFTECIGCHLHFYNCEFIKMYQYFQEAVCRNHFNEFVKSNFNEWLQYFNSQYFIMSFLSLYMQDIEDFKDISNRFLSQNEKIENIYSETDMLLILNHYKPLNILENYYKKSDEVPNTSFNENIKFYQSNKTQEKVCVKFIHPKSNLNKTYIIYPEIDILLYLNICQKNKSYVINLKWFEVQEDRENSSFTFSIITEYLSYTLDGIKNNLDEKDKIIKCKKIMKSLFFMHSLNVYHLDIKPQNIMVEGDNVLIIDFGTSLIEKKSPNNYETSVVGTQDFMDPKIYNIFNRRKENPPPKINIDLSKADVFSAGVTFYHLFYNMFNITRYRENIEGYLAEIDLENKEVSEILKAMTRIDSSQRIDAKESYKRFKQLAQKNNKN